MPLAFRAFLAGMILLALPSTAPYAADVDGHYAIYGHEMGGGRYSGKVAVAKEGDTYTVIWLIGGDVHRGTGILANDVFSVTFIVRGSPIPGLAVYKVDDEGMLTGQFTVLGGKRVGAEIWKRADPNNPEPEPAPQSRGPGSRNQNPL